MTKKTSKLQSLRRRIDLLDDKVVDLLVKRFELAGAIGETKQETGTPVKDPEREGRVLKKIRNRAAQPLTKAAAEKIYRVILAESRGMQAGKMTKRS